MFDYTLPNTQNKNHERWDVFDSFLYKILYISWNGYHDSKSTLQNKQRNIRGSV